MKTHKLIAMLLSLAMVIGLMTPAAMAEESSENVATVAEVEYATLAEAIKAAKAGATVTLLRNASGSGVVIDKNITIDFGGYTYTFTEPAVGSNGTESNGFQILSGNKVTLQDGTLKVDVDYAAKYYILVQNYADLTLANMTLDGTNLDKWSKHEDQVTNGDSYVLSNNCGNVVINGVTNIIANDEGSKAYAFDVCQYGNYTPPVVTVNTSGKIQGAVDTGSIGEAQLTILGGSFVSDPTTYVADGYIVMKDGADYKVVAKSNLTAGIYMADPTGATAANYYVTNNNDGTWTVAYKAPSTGGGSSSGGSSSGSSSSGGASSATTGKDDGIKVTVTAAAANAAAKKDEPVTLPVEVEAAESAEEAVEISVNVPKSGAKVEIPVENVTPGTVVIIVNADGTESVVPLTTLTEDGVVVTLEDDATIKVVDNSKDFVDVPDGYALADSIDFVSARGLFEGTTETTFTPHANTTIAQTMTVLARLSGEDFYGAGSTTKGAEWATEKGLSDGTDVSKAITREQMVMMMWKLAGMPESDQVLTASDVNDISSDALTAMQWAVEMEILKGNLDGTLNPNGNASRAHVAAFAERYVNVMSK